MSSAAAPAPMTGRRRFAALGAVALAACAAGLAARESGALEPLEREALKARFDVRGPEPVQGLLVVGIDAKSFDDLQARWPFKRSLHGRVVRRLQAAGARTIVYDVQFTEKTKLREDLALYNAIGDAGGAILATSESYHGRTNVLGGDDNLRAIDSRAAASDLRNDTSGAIASFPDQVAGLDSIAVATAKRITGEPPDPAGFRDGKAWIDFRGPPGTIPTVSFSDVLHHRVPDSKIRGRIVVVGGTAPTLRDVHSTPVGGEELMPGRRGPGQRNLDCARRSPTALGRSGTQPRDSRPAGHAGSAGPLAAPTGRRQRRHGARRRRLPRRRPARLRERRDP